ncbi:hypothetical protein ABFX02_08G228600 [Erythranthe guttata]
MMCKLKKITITILQLLIFLTTFNLLISKSFSLCAFEYAIEVVSNLPAHTKSLKLQCWADDGTDLGLQTLDPNQGVYFTTCTKVFEAPTTFYCFFHWRQKKYQLLRFRSLATICRRTAIFMSSLLIYVGGRLKITGFISGRKSPNEYHPWTKS